MFDVITIGTATRDTFITSKSFHSLKDKKALKKLKIQNEEAVCFGLGSKFEINAPILTTGGGAGNAAVTFARMGLKTGAFVKVGNDRPGEAIVDEFKDERVESFAVKDRKNSTAYSVIFLAADGERTVMVYRGASENISKDDLSFNKMNTRWAYVVPGKIPYPTVKTLIDYLHSHGVYVALNPSKSLIDLGLKKILPLLKKTKVLILNREEAADLTEKPYNKPGEIFKILDSAVDGILAMTDGDGGSYVSDNKIIYGAGTYKEKWLIDRTGAGDAFGSGLVSGLIIKDEMCLKGRCDPEKIKYAIRLGSANAASVIERIGAKGGILTREQFENDKRWRTLRIKTTKI